MTDDAIGRVGTSPRAAGGGAGMVWGATRPYEKIGVAHRPLKGSEDGFPGTRVNVRHCNDQVDCEMIATAEGAWDPAEAPLSEPVPDSDRDT